MAIRKVCRLIYKKTHMKAAWYSAFGPAKEVLQVGEWETPTLRAGEVKVKLMTSAVNPSDTKKRAGASPTLLDNGPVIPNSDGAGVIEAVGEGVNPERVGQRVWVYNGQYGRRLGTSAEYICLPEEQAVFLPDEASFEVGACMAIPAMTAHRCVTTDGDIKNKLVLVTGGAGRVGHYAIQWAKHFGAKVIATAGSETSKRHCLEAGADLVVGHPSAESNAAILAFSNGEKLDLVVEGDFGVNLPYVLDILKTSGVIATYSSMTIPEPCLPFRKMLFMDVSIRVVLVYAMPKAAKQRAIADITTLLQDDKLKHRIRKIFPLDQIPLAHEMIEAGDNYGCVLLSM